MKWLSIIILLLIVGCGESGEKDKLVGSKNKQEIKEGSSSAIAPIKRAKKIKDLEEKRQSKLKKEYEKLREEGL